MNSVFEQLHAAGPTISKILSCSGTAGAAVGVLHHGEVIHTAGYGFRDVERQLPMDDKTIISLFSLTKAMTASAIGLLVEQKKCSWDSTLRSILPNFTHHDSTIANHTTIRDLLSHRTGLAQYNALWMQDFGRLYLPRDQTLITAATLPVTKGFRESFQYNNWNYGLAALVVDALNGTSLGSFLVKNLFTPLGLQRTTVTRGNGGDNVSEGYMALSNGSVLRTERPFVGDDQIMFGAQGVNSCVHDLLVVYRAMMQAAKDQHETGSTTTEGLPFAQMSTIFSNQIPISGPSLLERSAGLGWCRAQLPNMLSEATMNGKYLSTMPTVARGTKSQLALYHAGTSAASQNFVILLPETQSAIVVLTNTMANCDASNWIASLLLESLLDCPTRTDFESLAKFSANRGVEQWHELRADMEELRKPGTKPRPLPDYTGKYWNLIGNWYLDVYLEAGALHIAFQGDHENSHEIRHYHDDVFTWLLTQDGNAAIGRFPYTSAGQWLLNFESENDTIVQLRWNQNGILNGELFYRKSGCKDFQFHT